VDGELYMAHRLAWLYVTGRMPSDQIDHINGLKDDNRWNNLREATNKENSENLKQYSNNKTGFRGVHFHKPSGKWVARVTHHYADKYFGYFDTPEAAAEAARTARSALFTHDVGRAA
jgi:hypothetical protein